MLLVLSIWPGNATRANLIMADWMPGQEYHIGTFGFLCEKREAKWLRSLFFCLSRIVLAYLNP